jgi:cyanophycinase
MRTPGRLLALLLAALALAGVRGRGAAQTCAVPCVGPVRGELFAAGGGHLAPRLYRRFVILAGGSRARIVVIPTAETETGFPDAQIVINALRDAGAGTLTILHTRDRARANDSTFVIPLRTATGVWITGGRQYRLVDAYLGTLTQREIQGVLDRGGVVGGNSAGASILASYLIRGAPVGNALVMAPGYEQGFGFLREAAIDQHREGDLPQVLKVHPFLLGIGIDEGTAAIIIGDLLQVMGRGKVVVYDSFAKQPLPAHWLSEGDVFDLGARRLVREGRHR